MTQNRDQSMDADSKSPDRNRGPLYGAKILLVEDSPDQQRFYASILQKAGASLTLECNGRAAFDQVVQQGDESPFDLIVLDMQMPLLNGIETTRLLRQSGYDLPVVAMTANDSADLRSCWYDAGCNIYLEKPVNPKHLLSIVGVMIQSERTPTTSRSKA